MLDSKVLNTDYNLAEMKDLCLPNLLMNADFKSGIINQRGQTQYNENNKYTIDRWVIRSNSQPSLTVNSKSVTLNNDSSLIQFVSLELGKTYTFVAMINGDLKTLTFNATDSSVGVQNEWLTSYLDSSNSYYCVGVRNGNGNKEISYLKLEEGSVYTGMPQWNYVDELLNCQRFFYPLGGGWIGMFPARSDETTHLIYIQTPIIMRSIPSLIVKDGSDSSNALAYLNGYRNSAQATQVACSSFTVSETNIFVVLTAPVGSTTQIGYGFAIFQKPMALDAEIY